MGDYLVDPLSDDEISCGVLRLRELLGIGRDVRKLDIVDTMRKVSQLRGTPLFGLELRVVPDEQLGVNDEAYAECDPPRITVKNSIMAALSNGDRRARMTFAHELMHIWLEHRGAPKYRRTDKGPKVEFIPSHKSAEHQAKRGAAEFLAPLHLVEKDKSPAEIAETFDISIEAASVRLKQAALTGARKAPAEVLEFLGKHKPIPQQKRDVVVRAQNSRSQDESFWERAAHAPPRDPALFRLCLKGNLVQKSEYMNHRSPLGWCVKDGYVRSYADLGRYGLGEWHKRVFDNSPCPQCGNFTLDRTGISLKCATCGSTSGCS